ncbi:uncharacterized protein C5L36_0B11550 [Pichia kudriavzevii]|uniref:Prokaryotic-type class I peptide chain release factors domain-containing protein n=1 Tax=Pichia kudriavzevii TaxID=4909 RepID=A0A099P350_PICKU|nr:uncharacterized protein C5L36_0B11550 [Pichia kudriavzevii]AWU75923.1 hypothetical protein C5L36_0B11550 [Pichia kudriavzevii]KGK39350.1 hypothetical protein JL09_g1585 [Pichia kudriavzevii]ONH77375.1 hypothetical protein BOH78_0654 [Pichia kudriavzevii]
MLLFKHSKQLIRSCVHVPRYFTSCLPRWDDSKIVVERPGPASPLKELQRLNISIPKANKMPSRPTISESDIEEKFIKGGSGKGGQKINKTNSKVQLTHIPTGIVVTSQATRSREQNRKIARQILASKIEDMEKGVLSRNQIVIARKQMVKQRAKRKSKAKYAKLAEDKKKKEGDVKVEETEEGVVVIVEDVVNDNNGCNSKQ